MISVKFTNPNQSNCEAGTTCITLTYDSTDLTCLGVWQLREHTGMYLRGAGSWFQTQMRERQRALCMCSFLDKALFLMQEETSTHLLADQMPLVNSVLSISWVETDGDADMDKSVPQLCESNRDYTSPPNSFHLWPNISPMALCGNECIRMKNS